MLYARDFLELFPSWTTTFRVFNKFDSTAQTYEAKVSHHVNIPCTRIHSTNISVICTYLRKRCSLGDQRAYMTKSWDYLYIKVHDAREPGFQVSARMQTFKKKVLRYCAISFHIFIIFYDETKKND